MPPRRKKFQVPRKTTSSEGPPKQVVTPPPGPSKPTPNRAASRPLTAEQQAAVDAPQTHRSRSWPARAPARPKR